MSFTYHCGACGRIHTNSGPCATQGGGNSTRSTGTSGTVIVTTDGIYAVRRRPDDDNGLAGVPARVR